MSEIDGLTGLNNRAAFEEAFSKAKQSNLCVIYFDINNLKYTNDNFGHRAGDKLIKETANAITDQFRAEEVYRTGGDEFIVLMNGVGPKIVENRLKLISSKLEKLTSEDKDGIVYQVASGYAIGDRIKSKIDIENEAESNMYFNKKAMKGKNISLDARAMEPIRGFQGTKNTSLEIDNKPIKEETIRKVNENVPKINKYYLDVCKEPLAGATIALSTFIVLVAVLLII